MSKLYVYINCKITKDRNCKVDNIQSYLTPLRQSAYTFDIQYQKIDLHSKIKLEMNQMNVGQSLINYMELVQNSKSFYYFVDKVNWKSTSTVEFELTLDTVNTFASNFSFNKKTRILRQHKDRLTVDYEVEQNWDVWDYVPVNKNIILNPWAWENEVADTFYVRWSRGDITCTITKYEDEEAVLTFEDVVCIEQDYVGQGQRGVAMTFSYYDEETLRSEILEYDDLMADFAVGTYWTIKFFGNVSDLVYSSYWESLFYGYYNKYFIRKVDEKEEGITPPQFKKAEQDINDPTGVAWNLVYKSKNQYDPNHPEAFDKDNAIECYLYPSDNINVAVPGAGSNITAASLSSGIYYYIVPQTGIPNCCSVWGNKNVVLKNNDVQVGHVDGTFKYSNNAWSGAGTSTTNYYVVLYKGTNNDVTVEQWYWFRGGGRGVSTTQRDKISTKSYSSITLLSEANVRYFSSATYYNKMEDITGTREQWSIGLWTTSSLSSIDVLDRTDSRILKIIKIPYSFLDYEDGRIYTTDWVAQQVTQGSGQATTTHWALKLMNTNAKFIGSIVSQYNPIDVLKIDYVTPSANDARDDIYESKVYNSEFYTPKFVYDSFNYSYNLENINTENLLEASNEIKYVVTTTMNSKFMFGMNLPLKRSVSDYDNICLVSRNNELPIYNSAYINYIRSGYNYDLKSKQIQNNQKAAGVALGAVGGILGGVALGAVKGSGAGIYGAAIGAAVGLASGLINMAVSQAQADNNLKQKLDELSRQAISVSGSDDIDLLDNYTNGNKAKYCIYQCSDNFKEVIEDLFYYCGYNDDVRKVPKLDTRLWFNYIQCEPVFNENLTYVYKDYLDDIKERYQQGVTVYHRVNNTYDWDQTKENWETSLLQGE